MAMQWIRRRRRTLLVSLLFLLLAVWIAATPALQWHTRVISLKLHGFLPRPTWSEVLFHTNSLDGLPREWGVPDVFAREKSRGQDPCPVLWETPMGDFWGRESERFVLGVLMDEQYLRRVYELGPVAIRSGDVVFDGGSHLGAFTRFALQRGAGRVVGFEPEATNIACYKRTFRREISEGRVILVEAALWEAPGTLDFTTGQHSGAGSVHPAAGSPAHIVPATTIDETVARLNLDRLDFIKMDIEGSERHALRGGRQSLARFRPRMAICIYHRPDDPVVVPQEALAASPAYQVTTTGEVAYFH